MSYYRNAAADPAGGYRRASARQSAPREGAAGAGAGVYTVSQAGDLLRGKLEGIRIKVVGEVSEVSDRASYKAVYFTIKDDHAVLSCMMWKSQYQAQNIKLQLGMLVELSGCFTYYAPRGNMNFKVSAISLAGEGVLRMRIANLAKQLQAEGLMDPARKRPLPPYPETVGLVTSGSGATVHDALRTLRRRWPLARVLVSCVTVEGRNAPANMIAGMRCAADAGAELIMLLRGGGSFEELLPFNDEQLARAIASMPVPVVTGIGHEPDNSIADMVSDLRVSTPTQVADYVSPVASDVRKNLGVAAEKMRAAFRSRTAADRMRLQRYALSPVFSDPMRLIEDDAQMLDDLGARLADAIPRSLERDRHCIAVARTKLAQMLPRASLRDRQKADVLSVRLAQAAPHLVERRRHDVALRRSRLAQQLAHAFVSERNASDGARRRLALQGPALAKRFAGEVSLAAASLESLSPLGVLARGYALARDESGALVKSVKSVSPGDKIDVALADGEVRCTVEDTKNIEMTLEAFEL